MILQIAFFISASVAAASKNQTKACDGSSNTFCHVDAVVDRSGTDSSSILQVQLRPQVEKKRSLTLRFEQLTYNHLPKAGGTFLTKVLSHVIPHVKIELETQSFTERDKLDSFTVGSVRNPCAYYVSMWAFNSHGEGALRNWIPSEYWGVSKSLNTSEDKLKFAKFLQHVLKGRKIGLETTRLIMSYDSQRLSKELASKLTAEQLYDQGPAEEQEEFLRLASSFDSSSVDCWIKTESLEDDLKRCLRLYEQSTGNTVDWNLLDRTIREQHESRFAMRYDPHQPCDFYYDDASRSLVMDAERAILDHFGYSTCC
jgi:hypothetical protein